MDTFVLAQQFYDYSQYIKGYSPNTIKRYKYVIDLYVSITGDTQIGDATTQSIVNLLFHGRTKRNWSSNTALVFHKSLMVFFRWCVTQKHIEINPVIGIEKPKIEQKLPQKITKQKALYLLEIVANYPYEHQFLRYRNHALFATFIFAGLRKNELLNLKYIDVDIENMTLFIRQGKGSKDRIIPISCTLAHLLVAYITERKRHNKTCPEFFASLQQNKGFTDNGLKHLVDVIKQAAGFKFSPHKLRHTFATLMVEGGCDIYSLSKMMGHSDIKTTTIYLSASVEHLQSQISKHPMNSIII